MTAVEIREDVILVRFDSLVKSGIVLYDGDQPMIPYFHRGFKFHFLVAPVLEQKPLAAAEAPEGKQHPPKNSGTADPVPQQGSDIVIDGFEICDVGQDHQLAANKFCYTRPQMLLLTKDGYKRQYDPLEESDFAAAWALVQKVDSDYIVFYNCGEPAGFSRLHRHVQVMPIPSGFTTFLDAEGMEEGEALPFLCFHKPLAEQGRDVSASELANWYRELRGRAEAASAFRWDGPGTDCPHNLVLTRRWIAVIPRRRACFEGACTNSLGMMGLVVVPSVENMEDWKRLGPLNVLEKLGIPKRGANGE